VSTGSVEAGIGDTVAGESGSLALIIVGSGVGFSLRVFVSEDTVVDAGVRSSIDRGVSAGESLGDGDADGVTAAVALAGKDG